MPNVLPSLPEQFSPISWDERDQRIVHVSNLTPNKRLDLLISAFRAFSASPEGATYELEIIGEGPGWAEVEKLVGLSGLTSRVRLTGRLERSEMLGKIATARALVSTSDFETFGMVITEALASGTPVVCTSFGGVADELSPEQGEVVPRGDASAVAAAINSVSRRSWNPWSLRSWAVGRFGPAPVAEQLTQLYLRAAAMATDG